MEKNIRDYIHHYLGSDVLFDNESTGRLIGINWLYKPCYNPLIIETQLAVIINRPWKAVKLVLRKLSDMTEEEKKHINVLERNNTSYPTVAYALAPHFHYLLSKGFDLFGLIESGLAIDKSTLKENGK